MRQRAALGSIKQLPDKRYKVTVTVGYTYDENGKKKQKRRSRIVNSMREAREMLQEYDNKTVKHITLKELIVEYFRTSGIKTSTRRTMQSIFNTCLSPLFGKKVNLITGADIDDILDREEVAETTMNGRCAKIKSLFIYAKKQGYINEVPYFRYRGSMRHTQTMKVLPSVDEMRNILAYVQEHAHYMYLYHIMLLIMSSGIRVGEACALRWENINMTNNTINVLNTVTRGETNYEISDTLKTDSSVRVVPVEHDVLEIINEIPKKSQFVFFGRRMSFVPPATIEKNARRVFNELGYTKLRLYDLRHFHATQLLAHGVDIKTVSHRLGHSSPMTTLNTYTHYVEANDRKAADMMGNLVLNKCLDARNKH